MGGQVNARFAEGDPIREMAALQREFAVFSGKHDLQASAAVLGLVPAGSKEREGWLKYLEYLKTVDSPGSSLNGHDLIRDLLKRNLEGAASPVHFEIHDGEKDPHVRVKEPQPQVAFSQTAYLVVSVPTWSEEAAKRRAVKLRKAAKSGDAQPLAKTPAKKTPRKSNKPGG
jgi:hypothetical protein